MRIEELDRLKEWQLRAYLKDHNIPFTSRIDRYMNDLIITADLPTEGKTNFYFDNDWD